MRRYLTKSRFKLALECPSKLSYTKNPEYANQQLEDPFLNALAEGGFQVGELAKRYYPDGHEITTLDYEESVSQTNELLKQDQVVIFEPAIQFENLFVRVDILVKNGDHLHLIEVKAKSYDLEKPSFLNKNGTISSNWKPYLYDVAFQKYVLEKAFPNYQINTSLMMTDKTAVCQTSGLNQKFKIVKDEDGRKGATVCSTLDDKDLDRKILITVPVDQEVQLIFNGKDSKGNFEMSFEESIQYYAD
ncbi:MAG: hypothetical protein KDD52_03120, partial [Bdellovibrionales bacterium]|nr:hypothetical protein [Bdellovibrionales bacterium]